MNCLRGIMRLITSSLSFLWLLDFSFLYESFFLCTDAFEQNGCRLVVRVLRYKFPMYRKVEYLLA